MKAKPKNNLACNYYQNLVMIETLKKKIKSEDLRACLLTKKKKKFKTLWFLERWGYKINFCMKH